MEGKRGATMKKPRRVEQKKEREFNRSARLRSAVFNPESNSIRELYTRNVEAQLDERRAHETRKYTESNFSSTSV